MPEVGFFGGSFDPVHNAHVALAHVALRTLQLDEVRWVPAAQPWQKTRPMTPAHHRVAMVEAAIAGEPRFRLDRIEVDRGGITYTLDTLRALHAAEPGVRWVLILGDDQYARFHTWHGWQELLTLCTLAVAGRPGQTATAAPEVQAFGHRALPLPPMAVSSTELRALAARGEDISAMVPPAVARYIDLHRLYAGHTGS